MNHKEFFPGGKNRKIIHVDMDAFFASVEQLDNPAIKGKPVIVGGNPSNRGVVAACSYEARKFGIHSAMPCAQASRLCPSAIFIRPRKDRYKEVSNQIMAIFAGYTNVIEPLSVDEAFLDVTINHVQNPSATLLAEIIRKDIFTQTGLTASAGISYNKFLAKIASDQNKPDGITVITPEKARNFIRGLPVRSFFGVGKVTEKKMHSLGIKTGKDLERLSSIEMKSLFGSNGPFFYDIVRGIDHRPVKTHRKRKSIGRETTLPQDILDLNVFLELAETIAAQVGESLQAKQTGGKTLTLKVRYNDFTTITRSTTDTAGFHNSSDIINHLPKLISATEAGVRKVRLVGLTISNLLESDAASTLRIRQLSLPFNKPTPKNINEKINMYRSPTW